MLLRREHTTCWMIGVRVDIALRVSRQPPYPVILSDRDLEAAPAIVERGGELGAPFGRHLAVAIVAEGAPLAAGDVGGGVGRQGRRVARAGRSEERRVGNGWWGAGRSRWWREHKKN